MSGLHIKKMICPATYAWRCYFVRHRWFKATSFLPWNSIAWTRKGPLAVDLKSYSTTEDLASPPVTKKKEHPNAKKVIGHVGRKIPYNIIQVLNADGEDMGTMHRKDVMHMVETQELKLISVSEKADPPLYRLLTGKQLYEEQLKLREKQKLSTSSGPIYTKELSFLASISQHDLDVKMKQVAQWIEKKRHVKITVLNSRGGSGPDKVVVLQQIIENLQDVAACLSQPKERKDGRAMVCTLRPCSEKELQKHRKDLKEKKQNNLPSPEKTENQGTMPPDA
ncbi:translation initiation factor IF-3, mitochondrial isoform X2 [Pseudophryne corroboree]